MDAATDATSYGKSDTDSDTTGAAIDTDECCYVSRGLFVPERAYCTRSGGWLIEVQGTRL
jgi:hypothetical protein